MSDLNHPFNRPEFAIKKSRPKKSLIIIAAVILLLAIAGGVVYAFREQLFGAEDTTTFQTPLEQRGQVDEAALSNISAVASTYVASGNTVRAMAVFDEAIEKTDSPDQKSALYHTKATLIASTDTPAAIKAAEQSVILNPNFENTAYLAELYERNGDNEKAIEYYDKAIVLFNRLQQVESGGPIDASLYQERIDRLRGQ
jgi:tetratricopeptide (TPR) repeat protein